MSEENVEIVRRAYEEVNANLGVPDEWFDPDYEFDARDVAPNIGIVRGAEAVEEALREYWGTSFEDFHIEFNEVIHADHEHVVTAVQDGGRVKGSDAEIWNRLFHVWTFRDGKVLRISSHPTRTALSKPRG